MMNEYINNNKSSIYVNRAISDLKNGLPIILKCQNGNKILLSAETILDKYSYIYNYSGNFKVLLSRHRVGFLSSSPNSKSIIITPKERDIKEIGQMIFGLDYKLEDPFIEASFEDQKFLDLLIASEILPAAIILEDEQVGKEELTVLTAEDIDIYKKQIFHSMFELSRSKLNLDGIPDSTLVTFRDHFSFKEHYALIIGDINNKIPSVRVHSSCFTGDVLGSLACDCGPQLQFAMDFMALAPENNGVIIYLMQDGRAIGLANKIRTYQIQLTGVDTVEANLAIGFGSDERSFVSAARILEMLGLNEIRLMTNNPKKANMLPSSSIKIVSTIPTIAGHNEHNKHYLDIKRIKMGHRFITE